MDLRYHFLNLILGICVPLSWRGCAITPNRNKRSLEERWLYVFCVNFISFHILASCWANGFMTGLRLDLVAFITAVNYTYLRRFRADDAKLDGGKPRRRWFGVWRTHYYWCENQSVCTLLTNAYSAISPYNVDWGLRFHVIRSYTHK